MMLFYIYNPQLLDTNTSMLLAALAVFIIDHKIKNAIFVCLIAAFLSFVGFIHGSMLGINMAPKEMSGYLLMALIIAIVSLFNKDAKVIECDSDEVSELS